MSVSDNILAWLGVDVMVPHRLRRFRIYRSDLEGYMNRWILQTPWGMLRIHHILRSDDDRALHDHPWDFTSWILWGVGYRELRAIGDPQDGINLWHRRRPGIAIRRLASDAHRLELIKGPVWTFVVTGQIKREWGFWVPTDIGESNLGPHRRWINFREFREMFPEKAWAKSDPERDQAFSELPYGKA